MGDPVAVVTGAAGFMGRHLVRHLAASGFHVRAVDVKDRPPDELVGSAVTYVSLDIRDTRRLRTVLEGADAVFHLASAHLEVHAAARTFYDVNVRATEDLVAASAAAGVRRFVHTSSVGIYGHVRNPPATEDSPKHPATPYERSKLAGEEAAVDRAANVDLDLVVVRPAWVYGPGCPRTAKLLDALTTGRFFYVGDGSNLRHPVYVDDMVRAYARAAAAGPAVSGRAYIIAGPRAMPLRAMVESFARAVGVAPPRRSIPRWLGQLLGLGAETVFALARRTPPFSRRSLAFFSNDNAFDTRAACRDLGFAARVDLDEGLQLTLSARRKTRLHEATDR